MQKLSPLLAGELGETLALAKLISAGLHAYISPPGAPGHDIMVVTPDGPKSIEVKTRQFIDSPSEINRWPVNMETKDKADYFLFIELDLRKLEPSFYLLNNTQAKAAHRDYSGSGNCLPNKVRSATKANDFSALTGEPSEPIPASDARRNVSRSDSEQTRADLRQEISQEATFKNSRVVQYSCQSIDIFVNGELQNNALENLRRIAEQIGVSEYNSSGGVRNTRQLGKAVIDALHKRP
ncbi:hypothetical protein K3X13_13220 [Aliiroseovarius crassostreae]|uniref:hypothetical protein n=1 Tax=Aliiroseovarius crassostreae TaxID=154981 RepID=UPI00220E29EB|nr:hypothetical protein [Aliiroseovarius crassostreae]UWP91970.1 hypothetical protein K3X13_13220 [Aliiroseovarius crassostreae]